MAVRRIQFAQAAVRAAQPLVWIDRVFAHRQWLSPLAKIAAVPLGFLLKRSIIRRSRVLGFLLRWGPVALGAASGLAEAQSRRRRG